MRQFVDSFTKRGLKVGLCYCWRNPGFEYKGEFKVLPPECDPTKHTAEEQIAFQKKQSSRERQADQEALNCMF